MVKYLGPGLKEVKQRTIKNWGQESMDNHFFSFDHKHPGTMKQYKSKSYAIYLLLFKFGLIKVKLYFWKLIKFISTVRIINNRNLNSLLNENN